MSSSVSRRTRNRKMESSQENFCSTSGRESPSSSENEMVNFMMDSTQSLDDQVISQKLEEEDLKMIKQEIEMDPLCCVRNYDLHAYTHLPDYLKHNQFIKAGYRVNLTFWQTTHSFFHWHNETLNVWTHFGGFLLFIILAIASYATWLDSAALGEIFSSTAFFISAMTMMLFSTIFHLYSCCSSKTYDLTAKLDYSGIAILIVGSYYPLLYYIYYCPEQWIWRYGYGAIISLFGAICLWAVWRGIMHTPGTELFRLAIFLGMGLFGVFPLPQSILSYGWKIWPVLGRCCIMGFCYVFGALIYGFKWPESIFPGKFDSIFSSHNIWHCFVLGGAISHYFAVMAARSFRLEEVGTTCAAGI